MLLRISNYDCNQLIKNTHYTGIRYNLIKWNESLKEGDKKTFYKFSIWSNDLWEVGIVKPGKYAFAGKPNDFKPVIWCNGVQVSIEESFNSVYSYIWKLYRISKEKLFYFFCILVRDSFTLDYIERTEDEISKDKYEKEPDIVYTPKKYKYVPLQSLVDNLSSCPYIESDEVIVPFEVFIQYIALIAVDEDVSYYKDSNPYRGKVKNLLSYLDTIPQLNNERIVLDTKRDLKQISWDDIKKSLLRLSSPDYIITGNLIEDTIFPE